MADILFQRQTVYKFDSDKVCSVPLSDFAGELCTLPIGHNDRPMDRSTPHSSPAYEARINQQAMLEDIREIMFGRTLGVRS